MSVIRALRGDAKTLRPREQRAGLHQGGAPAATPAASSRSARCLPMTSSMRNFDVAGRIEPTRRLTIISEACAQPRPVRGDEECRLRARRPAASPSQVAVVPGRGRARTAGRAPIPIAACGGRRRASWPRSLSFEHPFMTPRRPPPSQPRVLHPFIVIRIGGPRPISSTVPTTCRKFTLNSPHAIERFVMSPKTCCTFEFPRLTIFSEVVTLSSAHLKPNVALTIVYARPSCRVDRSTRPARTRVVRVGHGQGAQAASIASHFAPTLKRLFGGRLSSESGKSFGSGSL